MLIHAHDAGNMYNQVRRGDLNFWTDQGRVGFCSSHTISYVASKRGSKYNEVDDKYLGRALHFVTIESKSDPLDTT